MAATLLLLFLQEAGTGLSHSGETQSRSRGVVLCLGGWAVSQFWLFWGAPIVGGSQGGAPYKSLFEAASPVVAERSASLPPCSDDAAVPR